MSSRSGLAVTRLRRPGDDPVRLLVVADTDSVDPLTDERSPLLLEVLDRLWLRLRRGLEVDVLQQPSAAFTAMARTSSSTAAQTHDLVVVLLTDPSRSRRLRHRLGRLLDRNPHGLGAATPTVLVLPAGRTAPDALPLGRPSPRPRHRLDSDSSLEVVHGGSDGSIEADSLARHLQEALERHAPARSAAGAEAGVASFVPPGLERRLAQITRIARDAFDTDTAAVNLAAGSRLQTIAAAGGERGSQPRTGSLCDLTVKHNGLVVLTDTFASPSLQSYRALHLPEPVRFYAGHPILSPDGVARGALCVYDRAPHDADEFDFTLLRDLALLVEGELLQADSSGARTALS